MTDNFGFRFRDWKVYADARMFRREVYAITNEFPKNENYGLTDQARRAAVSILLNIAESSNKNTDKDKRVYINRAHCSLDEVVAAMDCALDEKYINESTHEKILKNATDLAKQLNAFTKYLSRAISNH
ncbi:MAG: four helix bundle protein [Minisyncoccales bacterium]